MSAFEPTIFLELNDKERTLDILDRLVEASTEFSK